MTLDMPVSIEDVDLSAMASAASPARNIPAAPPNANHSAASPAPADEKRLEDTPKNWYDRVEAFISKLSVRDNFWHSICSLLWLPLAFFSGIKMKQIDAKTFAAYLPFRRFNRNWYRAMAGGALLANSEIAGGMYVFGIVGGDYTVVCKELNYKFMRPCLGPAVYRMKAREHIHELIATGNEFNLTLDLEILQQGFRPGERDRRVGQCVATFHITPKAHHKRKRARAVSKA
jgi:acyl-coenzyme A thioesterase PaaI-like protein